MLATRDLSTAYGGLIALSQATIEVKAGEIVCVAGANGAGKSTLLKTIAGMERPSGGSVEFLGERIDGVAPHLVTKRGIAYVPENRRLFPRLSVADNLRLGSYLFRSRSDREAPREMVLSLFPRLGERLAQRAETLSGGEQQMLAMARALMLNPEVLLLDEPSMGLAPRLVEEIFAIVGRLNRETGVTLLVAEQNTNIALRCATYGYILENGRIVLEGSADSLRSNEDVKEFYLGLSDSGRRNFRDTKSFRRRKRWL